LPATSLNPEKDDRNEGGESQRLITGWEILCRHEQIPIETLSQVSRDHQRFLQSLLRICSMDRKSQERNVDLEETETAGFDAKVGISADLKYGVAVSESLASSLGVVEKQTFESQWLVSNYGVVTLLKDNPFLGKDQKETLSQEGLAREGATLQRNEPLISAVGPTLERSPSGEVLYENLSVYLPGQFDGCTVTESAILSLGDPDEKSSATHVKVSVEINRQLIAGSSIELGGSVCLVTRVVADEQLHDQHGQAVEIALSEAVAKSAGISNASSAFVTACDRYYHQRFSQTFGPRSLITNQPLTTVKPPITIDTRQIKWLAENGYPRLIDEFVTLRSDASTAELTELREASVQSGFVTFPWQNEVANETLIGTILHLNGLGLGVNVDRDRDDQCIEMRIAPRSDEEVLDASSGDVKKPETVDHRTFQPCDDGLFCTQIFGEESKGSPSIAELMTGLSAKEIDSIVGCLVDVAISSGQFSLVPTGESQPNSETFRGARGIMEIVKLRIDADGDSFPGAFQKNPSLLSMSQLPVLPPDWRPIVMLDSGSFATSDLNDHYRRVINRNNRLRKLIELNAPEVILNNETRMLQLSVDALFANSQLPRPVMGSENKPLKSIFEMLGFFNDCKRLCWLARDIAIPDDSIKADQVAVPPDFFEELKLDENVPVLIDFPQSQLTGYVALRPIPGASAIRLHPSVFKSFSLSLQDRHPCIIHRVLSDSGKEDAGVMVWSKPKPAIMEADSHFLVANSDPPDCWQEEARSSPWMDPTRGTAHYCRWQTSELNSTSVPKFLGYHLYQR